MRPCAILAAFALSAALAVADDKKPEVRTIDAKDLKFNHDGNEPKPTEIKSADELAKAKVFADDASRDAVKKHVDFAKEKLVVFAWSGSGGDKLTPELVTDGKTVTATFKYQGGLTDDFRRHGQVFAVPKEAEVKVSKAK